MTPLPSPFGVRLRADLGSPAKAGHYTCAPPLFAEAFERRRSCIGESCFPLERGCDPDDLALSFSVPALFDAFACAPHRLRPVAGFGSRRVEKVAVPRAARQPALIGELALALQQSLVDTLDDF